MTIRFAELGYNQRIGDAHVDPFLETSSELWVLVWTALKLSASREGMHHRCPVLPHSKSQLLLVLDNNDHTTIIMHP